MKLPSLFATAAVSALVGLAGCLMPMQPGGQQPQGGTGYGPAAESSSTTEPSAAAAAPASGNRASEPPAAPSVASVTLRNTCRDTVKVFFGDKPKYGSGTYSTLSGNSSTSKQFRVGDMIWIVDDSQNGVASATVSGNTRTIEVTSSCTGLLAR